MKKAFVAWATLISFSAFAEVRVGDRATYFGTDSTSNYQITQTVKAFDPNTASFTIQNEIVINGRDNRFEEQVPMADLLSDEITASLLEACVDVGGTLEQVTVPAGTFDTCLVSGVNIGKVPFGFVKGVYPMSGTTLQMELSSFSRGQ